jgi:SAM-dependent methyltransferase
MEQLKHSFCDLGMSPLSNAYIEQENKDKMEPFFPLHAYVCDQCKLVQLEEFETPENIFSNYAYFSSYSSSWLAHAKQYINMMIERFDLDKSHQVIEIASNDGYLLQYFKQYGIPVLGIEPAANVAQVAISKGINTQIDFFGASTAMRLQQKGDAILGNNVLAHVPDLNDFVAGLKITLAEKGIITMEFPHLLKLIECNQFDTIYHEHFSYFSLYTVEQVFAKHGLRIFDVEQLNTHGGSLRIFACHSNDISKITIDRINKLHDEEQSAGLKGLDVYLNFSGKVKQTKRSLLSFLVDVKQQGKNIAGYGAAAKGNTLFNYCGIGTDFIDYTVDRSPHKQGMLLPGSHIPIFGPDRLDKTQPDYILILPWNLREEIAEQLAYTRDWGCQLVVSVPEIEILR